MLDIKTSKFIRKIDKDFGFIFLSISFWLYCLSSQFFCLKKALLRYKFGENVFQEKFGRMYSKKKNLTKIQFTIQTLRILRIGLNKVSLSMNFYFKWKPYQILDRLSSLSHNKQEIVKDNPTYIFTRADFCMNSKEKKCAFIQRHIVCMEFFLMNDS